MGKYKKCPRCDLNYILSEEEMCDVCKAELGLESKIVLLDDIMEEEDALKLCPVCHTAYISIDEKMCESCLANEKQNEEINDDENDDSWRSFLDDDDTKDADEEQVDIPLEDLDKEFDGEDDEEEEEVYEEEDLDFVIGNADDFNDEDYDDDDEDDYDDDDDEDEEDED